MSTVILDNYDSFTYNLYQYFAELGQSPRVFRNDEIGLADLIQLAPERIIISPGPGNPACPKYFGVCHEAILHFAPRVPILGICLGHQGIVQAFGGRIVRAPQVMHGKVSSVFHDSDPIFAEVPERFEAMRYHSLIADPKALPTCFQVIATTEERVIMGVRHREYPLYGLQFHPESVGTPDGKQIIANFLRIYASPQPQSY